MKLLLMMIPLRVLLWEVVISLGGNDKEESYSMNDRMEDKAELNVQSRPEMEQNWVLG